MGCPTVEVFILLVTIPLVGNVGRAGGSPPMLEGIDTTGTEGSPPTIESMGWLETDLELKTTRVSWRFDLDCKSSHHMLDDHQKKV